MKKQTALKTVLVLSIAGGLFSGFLTAQKLLTKTCVLGEACQNVGPLPACAYGFIIYFAMFCVVVAGLRSIE